MCSWDIDWCLCRYCILRKTCTEGSEQFPQALKEKSTLRMIYSDISHVGGEEAEKLSGEIIIHDIFNDSQRFLEDSPKTDRKKYHLTGDYLDQSNAHDATSA